MLLPILVSVLIVFGSPYVGQLRSALQAALPEYYRWIVSGLVAASALAALVSAVVQLRRVQRGAEVTEGPHGFPIRVRYALVAAALAIAVGYAGAVRTGTPEVDIVEAFHFVEYGLVAYLFHRAWRRRPDVSGVLLAACAGVAVGVADEWVQWLVPGRVGEMHDVGLNTAAVVCGLLVSAAVHPPVSLGWPRHASSRAALGAVVGALLLAVAGFVDRVHLGHEVHDGQAAVFRSRYEAPALTAAAANRARRWEASPPPTRGLSREDHYWSEGEWHVARRNTAVGNGDWRTAWGENAILERFYSPVLDRSGRWSTDQRSEIEQRAGTARLGVYVSDAAPYPIFVVRRSLFWVAPVVISGLIVWRSARAAHASDRGGIR